MQCLSCHENLLRQRHRDGSSVVLASTVGKSWNCSAKTRLSISRRNTCGQDLPSADPAFRRTSVLFSIWPAPRASTYRCCRALWRAIACRLTKPSTVSWPARAIQVAILGLSFKPDSDDLRESPYVDLAETLLGKGYEVRIHDPVLNPSSLVGANRQYVESRLPHLKRILTDSPEEAIAGADIAIVSHSTNRGHRGTAWRHRRRGSSTSTVVSGRDRDSGLLRRIRLVIRRWSESRTVGGSGHAHGEIAAYRGASAFPRTREGC